MNKQNAGWGCWSFIGLAIIIMVALAILGSIHGTPPVNQYGDDPIRATVRAQYTDEAQATINAHIVPQATPIRVRIVP